LTGAVVSLFASYWVGIFNRVALSILCDTLLDINGTHLSLLPKNASSIHLVFKERPDITRLKQPPVTEQIASELTGHGITRNRRPMNPQNTSGFIERQNLGIDMIRRYFLILFTVNTD
jgi:hypothetical protein